MVVMGARLVIPQVLRAEILEKLSKMHQGATKTRQRARISVYWPNMDNDIENKTCETCVKRLPSLPPEPLKERPVLTRPLEQIHADLGTARNRQFLVMVDSFGNWPHVVAFPDNKITARSVIDQVRLFFSNVGAPITFWSDNGPQFSAPEFKKFLSVWGVNAATSFPNQGSKSKRKTCFFFGLAVLRKTNATGFIL